VLEKPSADGYRAGPSLRTYYSPVTKIFARISLGRKLVERGGTGAAKWHPSKNGPVLLG